jgi:hypothetical protein
MMRSTSRPAIWLALRVVEIGRDGDHRLRDILAEIGLGGFLHLLEDEGGNLRRAVILAARLDPRVAVGPLDDLVRDELGVLLGDRVVEAAADQPLDGEDRIVGVGNRLALCRLSDQALAVLCECDHRRGRACAFRILDDLGLAAFHHGNAAVGGAQVDTDHFRHKSLFAPVSALAPERPKF